MDTIGSNVRKLRKEAGWDDPLAAYDATGVKPSVWTNLESREPGPQGPALRTLLIVARALSRGLGRRVTIDELIGEDAARDRPAPTKDDPKAETTPTSRRRPTRGTQSDTAPNRRRAR